MILHLKGCHVIFGLGKNISFTALYDEYTALRNAFQNSPANGLQVIVHDTAKREWVFTLVQCGGQSVNGLVEVKTPTGKVERITYAEIFDIDDIDDKTFAGLMADKVDYLRIAIAVSATNALREDYNCAVWYLYKPRFLLIAASIMKAQNMTLEQVIIACDMTGIENRFFRLNDQVAAWINDQEPEQEIDYVLL